jgi:hypothetical protein
MDTLDLHIENYSIDDLKNLYSIDNNVNIKNIYDKFFDFFIIDNYDVINNNKINRILY